MSDKYNLFIQTHLALNGRKTDLAGQTLKFLLLPQPGFVIETIPDGFYKIRAGAMAIPGARMQHGRKIPCLRVGRVG